MNKYNSLLKGQPERMLWWWDNTHTLLCVLSIECDSSQCILLCEFWGLLVKMQTHERTWLCICKLCASDETEWRAFQSNCLVHLPHSRATSLRMFSTKLIFRAFISCGTSSSFFPRVEQITFGECHGGWHKKEEEKIWKGVRSLLLSESQLKVFRWNCLPIKYALYFSHHRIRVYLPRWDLKYQLFHFFLIERNINVWNICGKNGYGIIQHGNFRIVFKIHVMQYKHTIINLCHSRALEVQSVWNAKTKWRVVHSSKELER